MKPRLSVTKTRSSETKAAGADAALSLPEELVSAIHGAFEVAVEIAVREVSKLVCQATGDLQEKMRRENESLKQRLQRAEAMLDSAGMEERCDKCSAPFTHQQHLNATKHTDPAPQPKQGNQTSPINKVASASGCYGVRGGRSDPQHKHVVSNEEQRLGDEVATLHVSDATPGGPDQTFNRGAIVCDALTKGISEELPRVCVVRLENIHQTWRESAAQEWDSLSPPRGEDDRHATSDLVPVKQEKPEEEEMDASAGCSDKIKVEDFSPQCMLDVQSQLLEEWKREVLDHPCTPPQSCTELAQVNAPTVSTKLLPPTALPSLSSEFPNTFQPAAAAAAAAAPLPQAPGPQLYGVHVRSSRHLGHTLTNLYACKSCGQTFHRPSLLRRHYGQCHHKFQQSRQQQSGAGGQRSRLQLYPPGCSPFHCTECNRDFNRLENLKTHLRIHTGEMPFTCSICSKSFRHSGALTRHFRIHTGEKPYVCEQCGKSFRNCGGLNIHQRSHRNQLK